MTTLAGIWVDRKVIVMDNNIIVNVHIDFRTIVTLLFTNVWFNVIFFFGSLSFRKYWVFLTLIWSIYVFLGYLVVLLLYFDYLTISWILMVIIIIIVIVTEIVIIIISVQLKLIIIWTLTFTALITIWYIFLLQIIWL